MVSVVFPWFHFCFWIWSHVALKLPSNDTDNKRIAWNFPFQKEISENSGVSAWKTSWRWFRLVHNEVSRGFLWKQLSNSFPVSSERWNSLNVWGYCCSSKPSCKSNLLSSWLSLVLSPKSLSWREEKVEYNFFASLSDFLPPGGEQVCTWPLVVSEQWQFNRKAWKH